MSDDITIGRKLPPFSWLPNYIVNDPRFTLEVLAVSLYLNGKPEGWVPRPAEIQKRFGIGPDRWNTISRLMRELELLHERRLSGGGRQLFFEIRCRIEPISNLSSVPCGGVDLQGNEPNIGLPNIGLPNIGKSGTIERKILTKKDLTNKDLIAQKDIELIFQEMWKQYPLKKGKQKALESLSKILKSKTKADAETLTKVIWDGFEAHINEHTTKVSLRDQGADMWVSELPYLSTWLNQKRWEDGYQQPEELLRSARRKSGTLDATTLFN